MCTSHSVMEVHHHHSGLVGDVAVPVSARHVVLSCAFLNPDTRPRLNGRRSTPPFSARYVPDDLDADSSSWDCAVCMLWEHGSDPGTCPPEPRGQTAWGVWFVLYPTAKAVQCVYGFRSFTCSDHVLSAKQTLQTSKNSVSGVGKISDFWQKSSFFLGAVVAMD